MDSQDHKMPAICTGQECQGGVHLCHKCGWPFPNQHPSAKHRRAHKKICGTIEGYNHNLAVSEDGYASDEYEHTPAPMFVKKKAVEFCSSGGEVGEKSNKSEDDVFSDAVTEFSDSGLSSRSEESFKSIMGSGKSMQISFEAYLYGSESQSPNVDAIAGKNLHDTTDHVNGPIRSEEMTNLTDLVESEILRNVTVDNIIEYGNGGRQMKDESSEEGRISEDYSKEVSHEFSTELSDNPKTVVSSIDIKVERKNSLTRGLIAGNIDGSEGDKCDMEESDGTFSFAFVCGDDDDLSTRAFGKDVNHSEVKSICDLFEMRNESSPPEFSDNNGFEQPSDKLGTGNVTEAQQPVVYGILNEVKENIIEVVTSVGTPELHKSKECTSELLSNDETTYIITESVASGIVSCAELTSLEVGKNSHETCANNNVTNVNDDEVDDKLSSHKVGHAAMDLSANNNNNNTNSRSDSLEGNCGSILDTLETDTRKLRPTTETEEAITAQVRNWSPVPQNEVKSAKKDDDDDVVEQQDHDNNNKDSEHWDSPAVYPIEITKVKKAKSSWVPFVCCCSVRR